ncbi:MAG: hypothetical protein KME64_00350 [Scytonematopsis contorta HA4267-MV1]|jgi:hypothetical protein|nr:hypothetical protein [Scytonematopsis contorta HA4267-MV1]
MIDQRQITMIAASHASNGEVDCGQLANTDFLAYDPVTIPKIPKNGTVNLINWTWGGL